MAGGIKDFLTSVGMGRHLGLFHMRGYDDEADIPHLNVSDLQTVGITDPMEIIILLKAAHSYKHRPEYNLLRWLREHELGHYYEGFVQSGRVLLSDIAQLNLPDEDVYDELEITLPGHQRRLERAVNALRKRHRPEGSEGEEDRMVAEGWWGYPPYLSNAKFPFLCVRATMQSTLQPECQQVYDFMVDTGSDVCTLRRELIDPLQLESVTTVRSVGAHGSVRTTMYRAFIILGDTRLQVEVIASSYDSVGSQVLRHFSHHIDGLRHKWFRADSTNTPALSNSSLATGANSQQDANTEAETIPVLPEREGGAVCSRTAQENPGGTRTGGDGSSRDSDGEGTSQGGSGVTKGDETDSFRSTSQHKHAASPSRMASRHHKSTESSWSSPSYKNAIVSSRSSLQHKNSTESSWLSPQRRNTAESSRLSSQLKISTDLPLSPSSVSQYHSPTSGKRPRSRSDAAGSSHYPLDSVARSPHQRTCVARTHSSPAGHETLWTEPQAVTPPQPGQRVSAHQSGHVMISENGSIISLSFGRENKAKREDAEGGRSDSDL